MNDEDHDKCKIEGAGERHFYVVLYLGLAHWGAFIAIFIWLITIGMLLSTSQTVNHTKSAVLALIALWAGAVYLVWRVIVLGNELLDLDPQYRRKSQLIPHPYNHIATLLAASVVTLWDILLVTGCL